MLCSLPSILAQLQPLVCALCAMLYGTLLKPFLPQPSTYQRETLSSVPSPYQNHGFHLLLPHFAFLTNLYCKLFSTNARSCATNLVFEVILMLLFQMDNTGSCKKETLRRGSYCPAHSAKGDSHKPTEALLKELQTIFDNIV